MASYRDFYKSALGVPIQTANKYIHNMSFSF